MSTSGRRRSGDEGPTWAGYLKQTLDDLNALPGVTATGSVTIDGQPVDDPAAPGPAHTCEKCGEPLGDGEMHLHFALPFDPDLAATLAREGSIKVACETYSRRQVSAFADYRAAGDRAWQNYLRAMHAADAAYEAEMTMAGTDYDVSVRLHA